MLLSNRKLSVRKEFLMRKIVLACAVAGAALAVTACSEEANPVGPAKPEPTAVAAEATAEEKAEIDALGSDLIKLAEAVNTSSGAKRDYADTKLLGLLENTTDATLVDQVFEKLLPGTGYAKGKALSVKLKLKK